jgi:tetratricopeptide (TPR) repeat protein
VEGYVEVKPLGQVPVKGLQEPIEVYELLRAGVARSRLQASVIRGLTRFVGRDTELGQLHQTLARAGVGHGQIVAGVGEPGVGKSRLFFEFTRSYRTHGWLVLESHSVSYGKATPYLPLIELLKAYFGIEASDDARKVREKVTGKLLTLDRALELTLPAFLTLLEVPIEELPWQALDPQQRRQHLLEAIKRLLLCESLVQPVLLVFEDLHWIDAETQALLDSLVESLPTARLLLLVNYRPEYQHSWGSKTYYTQLRLDSLSPESAEELIQSLLGEDVSLAPLKGLLIARTQGNPFFLEETVWTLVETQALQGERGAYRLARALSGIQVPATVQAVLAARIDRLPPEEKRVLQTAAAIGTDVPWPLLRAIAEVPEEELHRGLAHLQAAEFLYETSLYPEREYTFKHALTYEVAYGGLLQERRRMLHARIVEAIETLYGDRLTDQVERLAHHALRGEVWDKAVAYFQQAGEKAMARSARHEAVGYFEQALSALLHLPETRHTREQAIDLRLALRSALQLSPDSGRILAYLREAEALAATLDDPRRLEQVSLFLSIHFHFRGAYDQTIAAAQRALALATARGDVVLCGSANRYLGQVYYAKGDYHRAIDCFRQTMAAFEGAQRRERFGRIFLPAVTSRTWLAVCYAELGTFAEGRALGEEGLRIAEAAAHPGSLMLAYRGIGLLALRQGDLPKAALLLEQAMGICQDTDLTLWSLQVAAPLVAAYTLAGRLADALPLLTQAMEETKTMERPDLQAPRYLFLGEAQMLADRQEEAYALAERALAHTREHQERGHQAYALRLLGEILAHRDPPEVEPAEVSYREALALADELGMRPLVAHCHLGLGTLCAKIGRLEHARADLSTAIDLYRAMEMTFWRARAETARAKASRG